MAFGDNSAARLRKAQLIQEQAEQTVTVQAFDEAMYRVYPDLPPGVGWVVKRIGTYAVPKWYVRTKEEALAKVNDHARMVALGRNPDTKEMRRIK